MGGWKLEVARMSAYLAFPVVMFYYFNQPEYFEEWVIKTRRELYPPENPKQKQMVEHAIREMKKQSNEQLLAAIEANDKKFS